MVSYKFSINLLLKDIDDPYGREGIIEASALVHTPTIVPKFFLKLEDRLAEEKAKNLEPKFTRSAKLKILTVVENLKHKGVHAIPLLASFGSIASERLAEIKKHYSHIIVAQLGSESLKTQDVYGVYAETLGISKNAHSRMSDDVKSIVRDLMSLKDILHGPALEQLKKQDISQALRKRIMDAYTEKIILQLKSTTKPRKLHAVSMLDRLEPSRAQKKKIIEVAQDTRKYAQRHRAVQSIKNLGIGLDTEFICELTEDPFAPIRILALELAEKQSAHLSDEEYRSIGQKLQHHVRWPEQCAALFVLGTAKGKALKCEVAQWIMHHYVGSQNLYVKVAAMHALGELKLNFKTFKWGKKNPLKKHAWKDIIAKNKDENKTRIEDLKLIIRLRDQDLIAL